jgi:parallel beta-helix repeat protein
MVSGTTEEVGPRTWYVDDDLVDYPAADFTKIQEAVDAASSGDTIIVYPGTYVENVDVNKDHLAIHAESGVETTIVEAANPDDHVFEVTADYLEMDGFTIRYANGKDSNYIDGTYLGSAGIYFKTVTCCTIVNSSILGNTDGIFFDYCANMRISGNKLALNSAVGVLWLHSDDTTISGNNITDSVSGMYGAFTSGNAILRNTITADESAMALQDCSNSEISANTVSSAGSGRYIQIPTIIWFWAIT